MKKKERKQTNKCLKKKRSHNPVSLLPADKLLIFHVKKALGVWFVRHAPHTSFIPSPPLDFGGNISSSYRSLGSSSSSNNYSNSRSVRRHHCRSNSYCIWHTVGYHWFTLSKTDWIQWAKNWKTCLRRRCQCFTLTNYILRKWLL